MKTVPRLAEPISQSYPGVNVFLESLEARIAPATLLPGGKGVTFTDSDGDTATLKFNKALPAGVDYEDLLTFNTAFGDGGNQSLQTINLAAIEALPNAAEYIGKLAITITTRDGGGDGVTNVGQLMTTMDMMAFKTTGDLAKITVGDATQTTTGLKTLTIGSLGVGGVEAFGGTVGVDNLFSDIRGPVGTLAIAGDITASTFHISAAVGVTAVTKFTLGGDLNGVGSDKGQVVILGNAGTIAIGGDLNGDGMFSGILQVVGSIKSLTIGGTINGGAGFTSGAVAVLGQVGVAKIGGIVGGDGELSGHYRAGGGKLFSVTDAAVGLQGGGGKNSALVSFMAPVQTILLAGGITGGGGEGSGTVLVENGDITGDGVDDPVTKVSFSGGIDGGTGLSSGRFQSDALVKTLIGDSVTGNGGVGSGSVRLEGGAGSVKFTGLISGSAFADTGRVEITGNGLKDFSALGLIGGNGENSGGLYIDAGAVSKITLPQVQGGEGNFSGRVQVAGEVKTFLGGNITGGGGSTSGAVAVNGGVYTAKFGNIAGGLGANSGFLYLFGAESLKAGNITGGAGDNSGKIRVATGNLDGDGVTDSVTVGDIQGAGAMGSGRIEIDNNVKTFKAGLVLGAGGLDSGSVRVLGDVKTATVAVLNGEGGERSGSFTVGGYLGSFATVGAGTIDGGAGVTSGLLTAAAAGKITVGGLGGGTGDDSGGIRITGAVNAITIKDSIFSGDGVRSASIRTGDLGAFSVGDAIYGSSGEGSGSLAAGNLKTYKVGGGIHGGTGVGSAGTTLTGTLGTATIGGGIESTGTNTLDFTVVGGPEVTGGNAIINAFTVTGSANSLRLIAGYDPANPATGNDTGFINKILVKGNFNNSSISLGVLQDVDPMVQPGFGAPGNVLVSGAASVIRDVTITGFVINPSNSDFAGVVASHILKASVTGQKLALTDGPGNDSIAPDVAAPNFFVREVV